jgi:hypothetical protein
MVGSGRPEMMGSTDGLTVAHWYNADTLTASPSQIDFLIFVPIFSFISIAYLEITPRFMARGKAL